MLSKEELHYGIPFVLKLWTEAGEPYEWVQILYGDPARFWFDIYEHNSWETLRVHAAEVFKQRLTGREGDKLIENMRCVVISTHTPTVEQLAPAARAAEVQ